MQESKGSEGKCVGEGSAICNNQARRLADLLVKIGVLGGRDWHNWVEDKFTLPANFLSGLSISLRQLDVASTERSLSWAKSSDIDFVLLSKLRLMLDRLACDLNVLSSVKGEPSVR